MRSLAWLLTVAFVFGAIAVGIADPTVAWYRFEEGEVGQVVGGNTRVRDSGPYGLDGWTPYGCHARLVKGLAPGSERAWDLSGLQDWFLVADSPRLAIEGSLTLEAWVQIRAYQPTGVSNFIIFRGDSTPGWDAYCLALNRSGDLNFHIEGPGGRPGDRAPAATCRFVWYGRPIHVAGVFNAQKGSLALYVNGALMDSTVTTVRPRVPLNPAMGPGLGVGGYHGGNQSSFALNGVIDEVRLSNAALEPSAFLCGPRAELLWMGTKGFECDGVEPDAGSAGSGFLFAVRCAPCGEAERAVSLQLRRDRQPIRTVALSRARSLRGDSASVYRARVPLERGRWKYRFVGPELGGVPTQWHLGPVVE